MEDNLEWLRIDNAGKIYPSTGNSRWNCVYRITAVLKQRVDPELLQEALEATIKRYPSFQVTLKKGVFWYYLHPINDIPVVQKEDNFPCQKFNIKDGALLFRVLYSKFRVNLEVFHSISDGGGGSAFMNTMLLKYFHLQGKKIDTVNVKHYDDKPIEDEFEDSYLKYYDPTYGKQTRDSKEAYHMTGDKVLPGVVNLYQAEIAGDKFKNLAKSFNITVNELIVAMCAYVAYQQKLTDSHLKNRKKPIKIQFAVNLRKYMPSISLRNFSGIAIATLNEEKGGKMTFAEVAEAVAKSCREQATEENMRKFINSNCGIETSFAVRIVPLFLKSLAMKIAFYRVGENVNTMQISNFGNIVTPPEFTDYIDRYELAIGAQKYNNYSLTMVTFNNKTVITVSNTVKTRSFERNLFRLMSDLGLEVTVNYNRGA